MISKKMCEQLLEGSLTHYKKYLAGTYKGYYITIDYKPPVYIVYIHATPHNMAGKAQFDSFLEEHEESTQYLSKAESTEHLVKLRILEPKKKKLILSVLNDAIQPIITQLLGCKYQTGCINCGTSDREINCYEISGYHHYLCEECIVEIERGFKDKQIQLGEQHSNQLFGTIGAVCGAFIGAILWVILYANGLFAWIAGLAIVICAYKGYEMFGGRIDKKGFIISTIVICFMVFLANHLAWAWSALDTAKLKGYSVGEIFLLWEVLNDFQVITRYFIDLLVGYGLTFLLGFKKIKRTYRGSIGAYSLKKCE